MGWGQELPVKPLRNPDWAGGIQCKEENLIPEQVGDNRRRKEGKEDDLSRMGR
jgi:hypothetical protein